MRTGSPHAALVAVALIVATAAAVRTQAVAPPDQHIVRVDGHPLTVWARQPPSPRAAVLLIHGRTWSSLPDFDLEVPRLQRSVLRSLVSRGLAAYAVDLRGYGATPRDATGWLTPGRAAEDVEGVLQWIAERHRGLPRPAVVGWSRGAAIGMLAVQRAPALASSLVMFGFAFEPGSRFADATSSSLPARQRNTADAARSDFISPRVTPPAVIRAFVDQALRADPVMVDLRGDGEFNELDPHRLSRPVLILYGERDPTVIAVHAARLAASFTGAPARLVVLAGADHAAHLENTHELWVSAVDDFVSGR
jgi:pimeloyl-ACP methyl ester carboxylesterase